MQTRDRSSTKGHVNAFGTQRTLLYYNNQGTYIAVRPAINNICRFSMKKYKNEFLLF